MTKCHTKICSHEKIAVSLHQKSKKKYKLILKEMKQNFDIELFRQWASAYWYVKIFVDYCLVIKGSTRKKFKFTKYETTDDLIDDIKSYMNYDKTRWD